MALASTTAFLQTMHLPSSLTAALVQLQSRLRTGWQALRQFLATRTRRQWWLAAACIPAALVLLLGLLVLLTPSLTDIRKAKQDSPAQILSADGKELALFTRSNRRWIALDQVSPHVIKALIATEDHRFYEHHGLDWFRTAASVVHTLSGSPQGGSTLTQQLARNLYPEKVGRDASLTRKLKEAVTAYKIEALYTKDEILETYLNTVPFLYNAFGIEMAARTYFDKRADQLNVLEAATLVGMLKGNSYYNPVRNPERALQRRNTVLSQMVKHEVLAQAEFDKLKTRPLRLDFERQEEAEGPAPHFVRALRPWLVDWADRHGYDIHSDGLVVHTTVDARMQAWANQAVARQGRTLQGVAQRNWSQANAFSPQQPLVQALVKESAAYRNAVAGGEPPEAALKRLLADRKFMADLREEKTRVQAGFLAVDPQTGHILAWVGSRDYQQDPFDHVQQARRQPGSTFKPFVYGAALLNGRQPGDQLEDKAVEIALPGGEVWRPSDAGPPSNQSMSLADGLAYSKNTITAQVMQQVGPTKVVRLAQALGVRSSPLDPVPALALGSSPVTLQEMVTAYASLARGGQYLPPVMVTRITNRDGEVLADFAPPKAEAAMDTPAALTLVDMLRGVIDKGTGRAIRSTYGIRADVAGKTGTTQGNADGWFILMHPQLVVGAWAGFNDGRITLRSDYWGQGARSALPMVGDFTSRVLGARRIDVKARFAEADTRSWWSDLVDGLGEKLHSWWGELMQPNNPPAKPAPAPQPRQPGPAPQAPQSTDTPDTPPMPGAGDFPGFGSCPQPAPQGNEGPVEERTPTLQEQGLPAPAPQPAPVQPPPAGEDGAYNPYQLPPLPGQQPRQQDREAYPMPAYGG
ncbi:penicillin-binding protein 1A [Comamonas sp. GB3 AK4-5]|uniref:penicillin-binding protein 1A n=1 Tax=Comamonas sp. GB3 AK4-5 TaxID=3231487 RepID=UPI00351DFEED